MINKGVNKHIKIINKLLNRQRLKKYNNRANIQYILVNPRKKNPNNIFIDVF